LAQITLRGSALSSFNKFFLQSLEASESIALQCKEVEHSIEAQLRQEDARLVQLHLKLGELESGAYAMKGQEDRLEERVRLLSETDHTKDCNQQHKVIDDELSLLSADLAEAVKFANSTKCEKESFLQCDATLSKFRSASARRAVQHSLMIENEQQMGARHHQKKKIGEHRRDLRFHPLEHAHSSHHRRHRHLHARHASHNRLIHPHRQVAIVDMQLLAVLSPPTNSSTNTTNTTQLVPPAYNASAPTNVSVPSGRLLGCTFKEHSCSGLADALMSMIGEIEDEMEHLRAQRADWTHQCEEDHREKNIDLRLANKKQSEIASEMASLMEQRTETESMATLAQLRIKNLHQLRAEKTKECESELTKKSEELCGIRNARNVALKDQFVEDCTTSDWVEEECNAACGGTGHKRVTRRVITPPNSFGAPCGPLKRFVPCNRHPCPTDCHLDDWSPWSECSQECGGGVKLRVRGLLQRDTQGGAPCGVSSQSTLCNWDPCEESCAWSRWSPWSNCTRTCRGWQKRTRHPRDGKQCKGQSTFWRRCNWMDHCDPPKGKCQADLDIVFAVDASGSVSDEELTAAKTFVTNVMTKLASPEKTMGTVIVFGGPSSFEEKQDCEKGNIEACGVQAVTSSLASLPVSIESFERPKHHLGTNTAGALFLANSLLQNSRPEAQSIAVVITDGNPNFKYRMDAMTTRLREHARLFFVVVRGDNLDYFDKWASKPVPQNLVAVPSYENLNTIIDETIQNLCPVFS